VNAARHIPLFSDSIRLSRMFHVPGVANPTREKRDVTLEFCKQGRKNLPDAATLNALTKETAAQ